MERANIQIMSLLKGAGADVLFIAESEWGGGVVEAIESAGCKWVGIELTQQLSLPSNPVRLYRVWRNWLQTHREIRKVFFSYKPTHIYLTNVSFFLYSLPLTGRRKVKTVFRLPNPPESKSSGWKQWLWNRIWKIAIVPRCDALICNSQYTLDKLRALATPLDNLILIYNSLPKRARMSVSDAPEMSRKRFNVIYIGRIREEKGVGVLYDAAKIVVQRHESVDFYLIGQNSWQNPFADALIKENVEAGLSSRIRFLDHVSDIPTVLDKASLHVCPSISSGESFPNVVLEAKHAGLPSVVFPTAGLPEAVVHGSEGQVCSEVSSRELAERIEAYVGSPALCQEHGVAARQSLQRYDEKMITEEWIRALTNG